MDQSFHPFTPERVKLIFNPISGAAGASPAQLLTIITEMQKQGFAPEVYLIEPETNMSVVIQEALSQGIRKFVVSGGDGTIDSAAGVLAGNPDTVMGIIPTGTQNNVALSLGIPTDLPAAVGILRNGTAKRVDVGVAVCGETRYTFLEVCTVGLLSALFPAADDIQHGNLARIGDLLATLVSFPSAEIRLVLNGEQIIVTQGHIVLVGNMPFVGPHYPLSSETRIEDGLLDVLVYANLTIIDLIGDLVQFVGGNPDDPRIQRYMAHSIRIETNPKMPVLADGITLGDSPVDITIEQKSLALIMPKE